ncbi:MAG: glutamate racemase [Eubacteriales bacterium]|nr:glutamate racemase [Eubacteriales bacterium]
MMLGIYDSGLGGLTALSEARRLMPDEDFIYFGDTRHLPYGTRSPDAIIGYSRHAIEFLKNHGAKAVLCACGTVSTVALDTVKSDFDIPVIGVATPCVKAAIKATKSGKIAVIGTSATIKSGFFQNEIKKAMPTAQVTAKGCDFFVSIVENSLSDNTVITDEATRIYLSELLECDTVILGCTHFPLISEPIRKALPNCVQINSGKEGAKALMSYRSNSKYGKGTTRFYLSDVGGSFPEIAKTIMPSISRDNIFFDCIY